MIHTNGTVYRYGTQVHCISTCTQYSAAAIYSVTVVLNLVGYSTTSRQTAVVTKFSTRVPRYLCKQYLDTVPRTLGTRGRACTQHSRY